MRMNKWVAGSAALHGVVLAVLLYRHPAWIAPMKMPGTREGTRVSMMYSPGRPALQVATDTEKRETPVRPAVASKIALSVPKSSSAKSSPGAPNPNAAAGGDARGTGNVTVALATFFPRPSPDLSGLAHGTRGDVIVDVVIDAEGKISEAKMATGLGHGVDEAVITTVQTWIYKPATKDGLPVASEQELLFHFERG